MVAAADGVTRLVFGTLDFALDLDLDIDDRHRTGWATRPAGWPSHPASPGCPHRSPASPPSWTTGPGCWPTWRGRDGTASAPSCASTRRQVEPIHAALAPDAEAVAWARRVLAADRSGTRSRPARRPHGRPPGGPAGRTARWPARATEPPSDRRTAMPSTIIDSAIFQGIFSTDAMRDVWSDENRTAKYLDIEAALAKVQGELGLIPAEAADEIVSHCRLDQIDLRPAARADRAHRLPDPRRGHPDQRALPRRPRRVRALGRHHAGHHRHRHRAADPRGPGPGRRRTDRDLRRRWPSWPRSTATRPMIGRSNLQQAIPITFGYKMAGLLSAIERHRERLDAAARAGAGGRVRRRRGHAGLAGDRAPWRPRPGCAPSWAWPSR